MSDQKKNIHYKADPEMISISEISNSVYKMVMMNILKDLINKMDNNV